MGVMNELGKKVSNMGQNVAAEAKKLADTAKVNDRIRDELKKIDQLYIELGKAQYEVLKNQDGDVRVDAIKASMANIEKLQADLNEIAGVKKCPSCGKEIPIEAAFCPNCGASVPTAVVAPPKPEGKVCPSCGMELAADARFCRNCGTKIETEG